MQAKIFNDLRQRANKELYDHKKAVFDNRPFKETQMLLLIYKSSIDEIKSFNEEYEEHVRLLLMLK